MDRFSFLGSIHAQLIDDQYEHYLKNPDGIEPSWRAFFQGYDFAKEIYSEEDLEGAGDRVRDNKVLDQDILDTFKYSIKLK